MIAILSSPLSSTDGTERNIAILLLLTALIEDALTLFEHKLVLLLHVELVAIANFVLNNGRQL